MQLSPELLTQKKKLQIEIMLKDRDVKKLTRARLDAEVAIRDLKHKQAQLQMDITVKENIMKKLDAQNMQFQNELIKLKHQMNNLGR
ncbi:MAG: hypothetical protein UT03_C0031G0003 [Candidatus Moranbacteria bacterium GW2011_GWD2_38_7]|nr:MAG: hypothetical protein UT03_C0031G0003 [Candidatus Moranbacteria bacterium GW2011_GWD2_38_7]